MPGVMIDQCEALAVATELREGLNENINKFGGIFHGGGVGGVYPFHQNY